MDIPGEVYLANGRPGLVVQPRLIELLLHCEGTTSRRSRSTQRIGAHHPCARDDHYSARQGMVLGIGSTGCPSTWTSAAHTLVHHLAFAVSGAEVVLTSAPVDVRGVLAERGESVRPDREARRDRTS
jgi:hypothetical protein